MQDILDKMYSIDNFTTYLIIAIVVLIVLFVLVLMLGKKDKKLEETRRLQKLTQDGFKDESVSTPVEVKKENVDILIAKPSNAEVVEEKVSKIEEQVNMEMDAIVAQSAAPILEPVKEEIKIEMPAPMPVTPEVVTPVVPEPVIDTEVTQVMPAIEIPVINEPVVAEPIKPVEIPVAPVPIKIEPIRIEEPAIKFDDIKTTTEVQENDKTIIKPVSSQIFSSVHIDKPKEEVIPVMDVQNSVLEDDDMVLPKLKTESNSTPNSFNFDSFSGESYNINK